MDSLEKTIVTCRVVLHTSKDEGLEDVETDVVKDALCTPEVPWNGYEVAALEKEPELIWKSHTSLNRLLPKTCCQ